MTCRGKDYLVTVDYYSKYPEFQELPDKSAFAVIMMLKDLFARHGIPETLMSDNMPFNSQEFRSFAKSWGIQLLTSSPTYAQSNGQAERCIQIIKRMIKKAADEGSDVFLALLEYRNTPITGTSFSPAQMLMGRALRTKIPVTEGKLIPATVKPQHQLTQQKSKQKAYYDRTAKTLRQLKPGDTVRIRKDRFWSDPAVITKVDNAPRSYWVDNGARVLRRNRRHLLKTGERPTVDQSDQDIEIQESQSANGSANCKGQHSQNATPPAPALQSPRLTDNTQKPAVNPDGPRTTLRGRIITTPRRFKEFVCK